MNLVLRTSSEAVAGSAETKRIVDLKRDSNSSDAKHGDQKIDNADCWQGNLRKPGFQEECNWVN